VRYVPTHQFHEQARGTSHASLVQRVFILYFLWFPWSDNSATPSDISLDIQCTGRRDTHWRHILPQIEEQESLRQHQKVELFQSPVVQTILRPLIYCKTRPISFVHFLLPPRGVSLGTLSTGLVDSQNMPPFCPTVPASVPLRVPSCFKDINILCFRLKKIKIKPFCSLQPSRESCVSASWTA
jgi:hypothetical protein